jgi:hypothetical protein
MASLAEVSMSHEHLPADQPDGYAHVAPASTGVMSRDEAVDRLVRLRERIRQRLSTSDTPHTIRRVVRDQRMPDLAFLPARCAQNDGRDALDIEALTAALIALHPPTTGGVQ